MIAAIVILSVQLITFFKYLVETSLLTTATTDEMHALMVGVALYSAFACVPAFIWNLIMLKQNGRSKDVVGFIFAILASAFALGFLIFDFVSRIHGLGFRVL